ncbi:MAG: hypothetical protein AAGU19_15795 [Prolixibacteraceae bacterium]
MKRSLLISLFVMLLLTATKAQDKIVTTGKDTIECRIISVGPERINYEQKAAGNQVTGKSIAISEVLQYIRSGHSIGNRGFDRLKAGRQKPEHRYLFSLQGGLAHSFTDFDNYQNMMIQSGVPVSQAEDYVGKLKNGYHLNAGFHYLLTTFMGIGADYTFFRATSDGKFLINGGSGSVPVYVTASIREKLYTHFAGPSVLFQQFPGRKGKIKITETLSPGIVLFRGETRGNEYQIYWGDNDSYDGQPPQYYDQSNSVTTSKAFGAKGGMSLEYCFTPQLSAGLAANFIWAKLHKASVKSLNYHEEDQELDKALNVSHLDYGFTVRYNF